MKKITIVGMGPGAREFLTQVAEQAITEADIIIGAERLLESLTEVEKQKSIACARNNEIVAELSARQNWQHACLAMSGDVGIFSGAKNLVEMLNGYEIEVIPGISSLQYFAAKLEIPWQDWRCVSGHGIACDLASEIVKGDDIFMVVGGDNSVASICRELSQAGCGDTPVAVGEFLSYENERICEGLANDFTDMEFDDLSVMLIKVSGVQEPSALWPWATSGIPDHLFIRGKAPMTKQEIRAVALSKLRVQPTDTVYDIGAGTGSVAIEMAHLAFKGQVFAVERNFDSVELIKQNAQKFGCHNVVAIVGEAPEALGDLPQPQAVFIGGSGGNLVAVLHELARFDAPTRICITAITLETLNEATQLLSGEEYDNFETVQVAVSRVEPVGGYSMMKAQNPVFILSAERRGK